MKVYTKTGDSGTTGLFGGPRVPKHDPRIDAYGTVDELNALLGEIRAELARSAGDPAGDQDGGQDGGPAGNRLDELLHRIQHELFVLGADLATPTDASASVDRIDHEYVSRLERDIDAFDEDLPQLKNFILPGGSVASARLHVARTVCRRAERLTVAASADHDVNNTVIIYLNRLSDLFFTAARWINLKMGIADPVWRMRD